MEIKHRTLGDWRRSEALCSCRKCKAQLTEAQLADRDFICPQCGGYNPMPARVRIEYLCDSDSFCELFAEEIFTDPIAFPSYPEKFDAARTHSGESEGVVCGTARILGRPTCIFVMEADFMMGSMGTVVGDRITALFEYAVTRRLPVIGYTVSGGARMQEGMLSLAQMAKTSAAVRRHSEAGLFYAVCATDPTMGGTTASFAMLGDVILAEPGARIGFAGRRVVEQVTGERLPEQFQSAEFQLQNGFVDAIVARAEQRQYLARLLRFHER